MGRFCPNVRTVPPPRKLNGFGINLKFLCSIKSWLTNLKCWGKTGYWRKLPQRATIHALARSIQWEGRCVPHTRERIYIYRALMGKPDGKRTSRTPRRRRKDNIKTARKQRGCEYVYRIHLAVSTGQWQWSVDAGLLRYDITMSTC
jgi:hypothetical protein